MTVTAAVLLTISALTHAGWNLFSKNDRPSTASFLLANIFGTLLVLPLLLYGNYQVFEITRQFWMLLFITGFFQALYFWGLAYAYKTGELSISYPLARSLPTLLVAIIAFLLGQGGTIGNQALVGMSLIVLGGFLMPLKTFRNFSLNHYRSVALLAAVVAAVGTAGYSLIDAHTLGLIRGNQRVALNANALVAFYYIGLQGLTTVFWQSLVVIGNAGERHLFLSIAKYPRNSMIKGAGIFLTYSLALISMGYVTNVSYVVAFRQLSIPIGFVFGILFLKEKAFGPKVVSMILLFAGVVLVGLG